MHPLRGVKSDTGVPYLVGTCTLFSGWWLVAGGGSVAKGINELAPSGRKWWCCEVKHQNGAQTSWHMKGTNELAIEGTAEGTPHRNLETMNCIETNGMQFKHTRTRAHMRKLAKKKSKPTAHQLANFAGAHTGAKTTTINSAQKHEKSN